MSEDLEARADRVARMLSEAAERKAKTLESNRFTEVRDQQADAIAELAVIVSLLAAGSRG